MSSVSAVFMHARVAAACESCEGDERLTAGAQRLVAFDEQGSFRVRTLRILVARVILAAVGALLAPACAARLENPRCMCMCGEIFKVLPR